MTFKKAQKRALADLDQAVNEYDELAKQAEILLKRLNIVQDNAAALIGDIESLVQNIRSGPFKIEKSMKKIAVEKEKFLGSAELRRHECKEKLVTDASAVAALSVGVVATLSFEDYILTLFDKWFGSKSSKNIILWLIMLAIVIVALIFLLTGWAISRYRTVQKAAKQTKAVLKKTVVLKKQIAIVEEQLEILSHQMEIVETAFSRLIFYQGEKFSSIPNDDRSDLIAMVNDTVTLSEMLNIKID